MTISFDSLGVATVYAPRGVWEGGFTTETTESGEERRRGLTTNLTNAHEWEERSGFNLWIRVDS
jgi:hypothetical protein